MEFVLVPGGCFQMGNVFSSQSTSSINLLSKLFWFLNLANPSDFGDADELPVHEVCLDNFYIGKYEVTQNEYLKITGNNHSTYRETRRPVESISWHDATWFALKLSEFSGRPYRLPTEAEWEYAARSAGANQLYAGSEDFRSVAWIQAKASHGTSPVGQKDANALGVYDMSGNVWEWCSDWYNRQYYQNSPRSSPSGPMAGEQRILRGGGWNSYPRQARTVNRRFLNPEVKNRAIGFRLVLHVDNNEK
jgi:formylglycine-generating enzyme required for sulfatase activity